MNTLEMPPVTRAPPRHRLAATVTLAHIRRCRAFLVGHRPVGPCLPPTSAKSVGVLGHDVSSA